MKLKLKNWFLVLITGGFLLFFGCENNSERKIKISTSGSGRSDTAQETSSTLQIAARPQRSLAVLLFKNETGDASLDWLKRGLTDMLTTDLQQSPYLQVVSASRFIEIAEKLRMTEADFQDLDALAKIAREAEVQLVLKGRYYYENELLTIDVEMRDIQTSKLLNVKPVTGESLERIFSMVNELSIRVRENLRGQLDQDPGAESNLAQMTSSLEAFRAYSKALESSEKLYVYEAEKYLRQAVQLDTNFAAAYLQLLMLKREGGSSKEAAELLKKLKTIEWRLSDIDKLRLNIHEKLIDRDYGEAISLLEQAVESYPTNLAFRKELAIFYQFYYNDLDRALEQHEIIVELDPNQKLTYNNMGYLYAARGEFTTAFKYFDKYQELAPDEPNPYDSKAEILIRAGRFDEAEQLLKNAYDKWPNFPYLAARLANLYVETGNFSEAKRYLDNVKNSDYVRDRKFRYQQDRAFFYWRFGRVKEALAELRKVIRDDPFSIDPALQAVEIYKCTGDTQSAVQIIREKFSFFQQNFDKTIKDPEYVNNLAEFLLAADLPENETIPFLEKLQKDGPAASLTLVNVIHDILLIKYGKIEKARESIARNADSYVNLISENPQVSWDTWKYVNQIIEADPVAQTENNISARFLKQAEMLKRNSMKNLTRFSQARNSQRLNEMSRIQQIYQELGSPLESDWSVIGPFAYEDHSGFQFSYPPENKIEMTSMYRSRGKDIRWQTGNDGKFDGYLDLRALFKRHSWSVGYALVYIKSPDERIVQIRFGSDEGCKLWLNNAQIWQHYLKESARIDRDLVTVLLHPGFNKLLVKVTNTDLDWGFYLRVTDENGNGFPDITFHSYEEVESTLALSEE